MRLELPVPREWPHPSKEFLAYGRLGYAVTSVGRVYDTHPSLAPPLATPCDMLIYEKNLALRSRISERDHRNFQ